MLISEEITSQLSFFYLEFFYIDTILNQANKNAGQFYLTSQTFLLSLQLFKIFNIRFEQINYSTDLGFVFEDFTNVTYYSLQPINAEISLGYQFVVEFSALRIINNELLMNYIRKYGKFQDLIAEIGGVIKAILTIAAFIEYYITEKLMIKYFAEELYFIKNTELENNFSKAHISIVEPDFQPISTYNNKKKINYKSKINLNLLDFICFLQFKKLKTLNLLKKISIHFDNILSVEEIYKKNYEIEFLKENMLNEKDKNNLNDHKTPLIANDDPFDKNSFKKLYD